MIPGRDIYAQRLISHEVIKHFQYVWKLYLVSGCCWRMSSTHQWIDGDMTVKWTWRNNPGVTRTPLHIKTPLVTSRQFIYNLKDKKKIRLYSLSPFYNKCLSIFKYISLLYFSVRNRHLKNCYGTFTLPDSDSDKVSDCDNITVHLCGTHFRIGSRIGIGSVSVNTPLLTTHLLCITNPRTFINMSRKKRKKSSHVDFPPLRKVTITNYEVLKPAIYYSKNIIHPLKMEK